MDKHNRLPAIIRWLFLLALLVLNGCAGLPSPTASADPTAEPTATVAPFLFAENPAPLPDRLKFEPFPLDPAMNVLSLLQDGQGFLWFGSGDALYRWDGYNFKAYRPGRQAGFSLVSARILYEDRLGHLWAATDAGLVRFNPRTAAWYWYPQQPKDSQGLSAATITAIAEDRQGNLWLATDGAGLNRLEPESGRVTRYTHRSGNTNSLSSDALTTLTVSKSGEIWIGGRTGLLDRLDPGSGEFQHFEPARALPGGGSNRAIAAILEDPAGDLWLAVPGGILGFDPQLGSFTFFAHPLVEHSLLSGVIYPSSLVLDSAGHFWLGTTGMGLYRFSPRTGAWAHYQNDANDAYSLSEDAIAGLLLDRSGILWITFVSGQVNRFNPRAGLRAYQNVQGNPNSLRGDTVSAVMVDSQGSWWVGTQSSGLDRFDPHTGQWTHYGYGSGAPGSLTDGQVTALAADPQGRIWIGTLSGGLNRLDPKSGIVEAPPEAAGLKKIYALLAGSEGEIWIGTEDGILHQVDPASGIFRHFPPPDPSTGPADPSRLARAITALAEDPAGRLWAGTSGGRLYVYDPPSQSWAGYPVSAGNEAAPVASLLADEAGWIWVGTLRHGLFRFDPASGALDRYRAEDGMPDTDIFGILMDDQGNLWLSTGKGLARFDPERRVVQSFGVTDGLPGESFSPGAAHRSQNGEMFFGSAEALVVFYPQLVRANPHIPPVVITDFQLFYEPVAATGSGSPWQRTADGDKINLNYTQNVFTFEYAALDFSNPALNQYAYRLEGFDQDWVEAGTRRQASYTNLAPGEYLFRVKASNNAGIWNENGAAIRVMIQPPFWVTGWFRLLAAGLVISAVFGGVGLRIRSINHQKEQLQRQVQERTRELMGALQELEASREAAERAAVLEERQRLARELHDSVTQLLYGQVLSADVSYKLLKKRDLETLEETLIRMREIAGQSLKEMRLLLYELRPSSFEEEGLVNALELRLDAVERRSRIESYLEVKGQVDLPPQVAWEIYRIAIEALNNSLKHAAATQVRLRLEASNGRVELEVEDNGHGFEVEGAEKGGFGISSMRQRAEGVGGQLEIDSKPHGGTRVRIRVPIDNQTASSELPLEQGSAEQTSLETGGTQ